MIQPTFLTYDHRSWWSIGHLRPLIIAHCSGHSSPVGPLLLQLCFSVLSSTAVRPASLLLPLRVPGQGLVCGAGCWLPECASDPTPLLLQYLLGHWFLSCSLSQIFISDLLLPSDLVDAPQTGVDKCLNLLLHHLCCPPCLTSVEQNWLHTGVEDAEFGSHADSSRCPDVFEHDESCSCLADSGCDVSVRASLLVNHTSQIDERLHLPDGLSTNCDWCIDSCVHLHQLCLLPVDLEPSPCWCGLQESGLVLHLAVIVWQERQASAKSRSSSCVRNVLCIPLFLPVVVIFIIQSMTRRKRKSESRHPCRTPVFTSKLSDSWPARAILQLMSWKVHWMREIIF